MAYESLCKALTGLVAKAPDPIETVVGKGISLDGFWDENKHPRSHGKFTKKATESSWEGVRDDMSKEDHPELQRVTDDDRLALHNALQKANGELNQAMTDLDSRENQVLGHRDAVYRLDRARAKVDHLTAMHKKLQDLDANGQVARRYHLDWEHDDKNGAFGDWIAGKRGMWEGNSFGRQPTHRLYGQEFKTHSAKNAGVSAAKREFNAQLSGIGAAPAKTPSDTPRTPYAPSAAPKGNIVSRVNKDGTTTPVREIHEVSKKQQRMSSRNNQFPGGRVNVAMLPKPNLPR